MQNPKSILITGASSGIGAALAEMYANPGITLFLGGRDQERLDQIAEKCRAKGATATITTVDVLDQIAMSAWIGGANTTNPLDLVIANAGISAGTGGSGESEDQTRHIFAVNVVGVINTLFPALEAMRRRTLRQAQGEPARPKGQIALMSSIAAFRGFPGAPAYCASKAAVKSLGESWRGQCMRENIEVSVICPGYVKTPMTDVNDFVMPLMMSAPRAAEIIAAGLAKNKARISFPFFTYMMVWFLMVLPPGLFDRMLAGLPEKKSSP